MPVHHMRVNARALVTERAHGEPTVANWRIWQMTMGSRLMVIWHMVKSRIPVMHITSMLKYHEKKRA